MVTMRLDDWSQTPSFGGIRHPKRRCGAVMWYAGTPLCSVQVCLAAVKVFTKATRWSHFRSQKQSEGVVDATIYLLCTSHPVSCGERQDSQTVTLETTDTLGERWNFGRWPVHRQHQHQGWRFLQYFVVIEVKYDDFPAVAGWTRILRESASTWTLASPPAASAPRGAASKRAL
jgi:hypothetical protein